MTACLTDSLFWAAVGITALTLILSFWSLGRAQARIDELEKDNRKLDRSLRYAQAELQLTEEWHG